MWMTIDDNVKQKLLNSLAEEPTMVISTAYAYAKNYVQYGEDITKAWTTAVQQASVIQEVRQKAWVEAYDSFKADYENRVKVDMVAMLEEIKNQIDDYMNSKWETLTDADKAGCPTLDDWKYHMAEATEDFIYEKINELKED